MPVPFYSVEAVCPARGYRFTAAMEIQIKEEHGSNQQYDEIPDPHIHSQFLLEQRIKSEPPFEWATEGTNGVVPFDPRDSVLKYYHNLSEDVKEEKLGDSECLAESSVDSTEHTDIVKFEQDDSGSNLPDDGAFYPGGPIIYNYFSMHTFDHEIGVEHNGDSAQTDNSVNKASNSSLPNKQAGGKNHQCPECQKCFSTSSSLHTHKSQVHTARDHMCTICGKAFKTGRERANHEMRHGNNKQHSCKECNKPFFTKKEVKGHMLRMHRNVVDPTAKR